MRALIALVTFTAATSPVLVQQAVPERASSEQQAIPGLPGYVCYVTASDDSVNQTATVIDDAAGRDTLVALVSRRFLCAQSTAHEVVRRGDPFLRCYDTPSRRTSYTVEGGSMLERQGKWTAASARMLCIGSEQARSGQAPTREQSTSRTAFRCYAVDQSQPINRRIVLEDTLAQRLPVIAVGVWAVCASAFVDIGAKRIAGSGGSPRYLVCYALDAKEVAPKTTQLLIANALERRWARVRLSPIVACIPMTGA